MTKEKLWTPEFLGFGISSSLFYMTQYVLITTLPIVIIDSYGGSTFEAGMAMTYFQIGTISCRPFAGKLIDSVNKRKVLLASTGFFLLIMLLFNFTQSLNFIFGLRLFHGMCFAIGTTATAALAAIVLPKGRKGEGIGYFAVFANLAMVLGPFFGLIILDRFGTSALFIFLTIVAAGSFYAANRKHLPDSIALPAPKRPHRLGLQDFIEKKALPLALMGLLISFVYSGVLVFVPIFMKELGLGTGASMFFAAFAASIVVTRPIVGRAFDQLGSKMVIYPGFVIFLAGMMLLSRSSSLGAILTAAPLLGIGFGALSPAFQTLAIQSAPASRSGVATATYFLSLDVGVGLGSILLSLVVERYGYLHMYEANGMVIIGAAIMYHFLVRKTEAGPV